MSKRISVAEIAELEALGITPETPAEPHRELTTKVHPNGWTQRECYCEKHGEYYDVFAPPRLAEVLIGADGCRQCKADKQLDEEARAALEARRDEVRAKVHELSPTYEDQVQAQVRAEEDAEIERYRAEIRPLVEDDVRGRLYGQLKEQVEEEVLAEIKAGLRGSE